MKKKIISRDLAATAWANDSRTAYLAYEITQMPAKKWECATILTNRSKIAEMPKLL